MTGPYYHDDFMDALAYMYNLNTKGTGMKQANLKELKCGAIVCTEYRGKPSAFYRFIGMNAEGCAVVEDDGGVNRRPDVIHTEVLYIPPVKKVAWVNLYPDFRYTLYSTEEIANKVADSDRIGGKAFRIEYEE